MHGVARGNAKLCGMENTYWPGIMTNIGSNSPINQSHAEPDGVYCVCIFINSLQQTSIFLLKLMILNTSCITIRECCNVAFLKITVTISARSQKAVLERDSAV